MWAARQLARLRYSSELLTTLPQRQTDTGKCRNQKYYSTGYRLSGKVSCSKHIIKLKPSAYSMFVCCISAHFCHLSP